MHSDNHLPTKKVAARYGVSTRTVERWGSNKEVGFPAPMKVNRRKYWSEKSLTEWERGCAARAA
jgi:predicted DNA-binding transcriptional regulator AlpA